jgi:hypothetical protein
MVFDVYGRFPVEVLRENDRWAVRRRAPGKRMILQGPAMPADIPAEGIPRAREDVLHEFAAPDRRIRTVQRLCVFRIRRRALSTAAIMTTYVFLMDFLFRSYLSFFSVYLVKSVRCCTE